MNEALNKLNEALDNKEFYSYLMGDGQYKFQDKFVENPTDITRIFIGGINEFVGNNNENHQRIMVEFQEAFKKMLKSPTGTWWLLSILYSYLFGYKEKSLLFFIDISTLVPSITESISTFKEELKADKSYVGWRFDDGLWEDVVFMTRKINEHLKNESSKIILP